MNLVAGVRIVAVELAEIGRVTPFVIRCAVERRPTRAGRLENGGFVIFEVYLYFITPPAV
jgi:hypothetical protein